MAPLFDYFKKFNPLSDEAKNAIEEICSVVTIAKKNDLQPMGHTCKTIYFIKKGVARIYYYKDGIDITEQFFLKTALLPEWRVCLRANQAVKQYRSWKMQKLLPSTPLCFSNCMTPTLKLKDYFVKYLKLLMWKRSTALKECSFIQRRKDTMPYLTKLLMC